jgi:hypothetical protein
MIKKSGGIEIILRRIHGKIKSIVIRKKRQIAVQLILVFGVWLANRLNLLTH